MLLKMKNMTLVEINLMYQNKNLYKNALMNWVWEYRTLRLLNENKTVWELRSQKETIINWKWLDLILEKIVSNPCIMYTLEYQIVR